MTFRDISQGILRGEARERGRQVLGIMKWWGGCHASRSPERWRWIGHFPKHDSIQHEVFLVELPDGCLQVAFIGIGDVGAGNPLCIGPMRPEVAQPFRAGCRIVTAVVDQRTDFEEFFRGVGKFREPRWIRFREDIVRKELHICDRVVVESPIAFADRLDYEPPPGWSMR